MCSAVTADHVIKFVRVTQDSEEQDQSWPARSLSSLSPLLGGGGAACPHAPSLRDAGGGAVEWVAKPEPMAFHPPLEADALLDTLLAGTAVSCERSLHNK